MVTAIKSLHVLWQSAAREIPSSGCFYTKEEFEKNRGKIQILAGHIHRIEKQLKQY